MMTGRTLLHTSAKGQQLDDHYLIYRALTYMRDLETRVYVAWNTSKTRHNVAPKPLSLHLFSKKQICW
jgi:glutamine synthetase type III